jgi:ParB family transcriptional regulator, chromosome partitioning protein
MKRRDVVQALLTPDPAAPAAPEGEAPRVSSGAVRAMGLEVGKLAEGARAAEALRKQIESGSTVLDLAADLVDPSFVSDRLPRASEPDFRRLVDSIRATGQQVPILVRPHPQTQGRYQIAYGHRRRDAAAELGVPVRAIVRVLTDAELVIAQGQENSERRDLSFIERALFAAHLQRLGFDRPTLHGALGVHKAEMTRLLAVAASIPEAVIRNIGAAPKAGRFRWQELSRDLERPGVVELVENLLTQPSVLALGSDRRFAAVIDAIRVAAAPTPPAGDTLIDSRSVVIGHIERAPGIVRIVFDERAGPGFAALVLRELPQLVGRYSAGHR